MNNIITFENVSFKYEKNIDILKAISFSINEDEKIGLIGANGVGKSTLMKLILGLEQGYLLQRYFLAQIFKEHGLEIYLH